MLKLNKEKLLSRKYDFLSQLIKLTLITKIKFFKDDVFEQSKIKFKFGHTLLTQLKCLLKEETLI